MSLDRLLAKTHKWPLFPCISDDDHRGLFHVLASLIISQRIRFCKGQAIRSGIYVIQGRSDLNAIGSLSDEERVKVGLDDHKWAIIQRLIEAFDANEKDLSAIKGIGPWTLGCASIMTGDYSCGFVHGDLAVRKEITRLLELESLIKPKELVTLVAPLSDEEGAKLFSRIWYRTGPYKHGPNL